MSEFFQKIPLLLIPFVVFLVTLIAGYMLRSILFRRLCLWASKTSSDVDDIIIAATRGPFIIW